uniref:Uncharacterized protein n=1 Tax=Hyaloperonospora arabidopsidis (strain Emoy2) TaxID=559515 RepID=M4BC26_HYAAE
MFQFVENGVEIERFRAQQRQMFRIQHHFSPDNREIEGDRVDKDDGRRRKISATRSQKQQQQLCPNKLEQDDYWPLSATGLLAGYNAFDFMTSPEAFCDDTCSAGYNDSQHASDVAKQVASMGFHCTSMW